MLKNLERRLATQIRMHIRGRGRKATTSSAATFQENCAARSSPAGIFSIDTAEYQRAEQRYVTRQTASGEFRNGIRRVRKRHEESSETEAKTARESQGVRGLVRRTEHSTEAERGHRNEIKEKARSLHRGGHPETVAGRVETGDRSRRGIATRKNAGAMKRKNTSENGDIETDQGDLMRRGCKREIWLGGGTKRRRDGHREERRYGHREERRAKRREEESNGEERRKSDSREGRSRAEAVKPFLQPFNIIDEQPVRVAEGRAAVVLGQDRETARLPQPPRMLAALAEAALECAVEAEDVDAALPLVAHEETPTRTVRGDALGAAQLTRTVALAEAHARQAEEARSAPLER
eukprot:4039870-Pleurochrysis_carterae.AAC.3